MNKKKVSICVLIVILFQVFMPIVNQCYASSEENNIVQNNVVNEINNNVENNVSNETVDNENAVNEGQDISNTLSEKLEDDNTEDETNNSNVIDNSINNTENEIIEENVINKDATESEIQNESEENFEVIENEDIGISVATASGWGTGAGNEDEFRNAFYNGGVSELTISTSIRLNSIYTVNHNLRIDSSSQTGSNALQLSSGCSIVVPSGCVLTLDEVVLDGRSFGNDDGKSCITVQNGGVLMLTGHSIIDGGTRNWGINVESGGQLLVESCQISYCDRGVVLQGNSYCDFASATTVSWWGNTGKSVDISYNSIGIYCGGAYRGNLVVNHISGSSEKINFDSNTWAIFSEAHSGNINIVTARMVFNGWAIYTFGNMNVAGINGAYNARGIVNDGGTVNFNSGSFYSDGSNLKEYGIFNNSGTVNVKGGNVYNDNVGICNYGTINMSSGNASYSTTGVENYGTFNFSGGNVTSGSIGLLNNGTTNLKGGTISGFSWGVRNIGTLSMSSGNVNNNSTYGIYNEGSNTVTGQAYITGGTISGNGSYDIYHTKSDSNGAGGIYGGLRIERNDTIDSSIYLGLNDGYIYTGSNTPTLNNVTVNSPFLERNIIRTASTTNASTMANKINVKNKGSYYYKANAINHSNYVALWQNYTVTTNYKTKDGVTLDTATQIYEYKQNYTTESRAFEGYVLLETPSNSSGTVTGDISVIYYYEEEANVALVNYQDLMSGVVSAKYWYNANSENFSGSSTDFTDGTVFEDYGYYKVVVKNGVGLEKTLTFTLNKNSYTKQ